MEGITDPQIIADCGRTGTVLLTADGDLETTWAAEIQQAKLAVVILTNNTDGMVKWGERLRSGQNEIFECLRLYKRPFALRFGRGAKILRVRLYGKRRGKVIAL